MSSDKIIPMRPLRPCPECKAISSREHYPFCSSRCKDVDLNRWLVGGYVISPPADDEDAP